MLFITFLAFFSGSIFMMGIGYIGMKMCIHCCTHREDDPQEYENLNQ